MAAFTILYRAGNGTRTRDPQLGKLMLYQLSYSRYATAMVRAAREAVKIPELSRAGATLVPDLRSVHESQFLSTLRP
jgi:hypothetical protein